MTIESITAASQQAYHHTAGVQKMQAMEQKAAGLLVQMKKQMQLATEGSEDARQQVQHLVDEIVAVRAEIAHQQDTWLALFRNDAHSKLESVITEETVQVKTRLEEMVTYYQSQGDTFLEKTTVMEQAIAELKANGQSMINDIECYRDQAKDSAARASAAAEAASQNVEPTIRFPDPFGPGFIDLPNFFIF